MTSIKNFFKKKNPVVYEDENLKIIQGDYREYIDELNFNYIITDPPYNINWKYKNYADKLKPDEYIELLKPLAKYPMCMIHHMKAVIEFFCIPNAIAPTDNFAWCYPSNLGRQHRDLIFFNAKADKKAVGMEYKNKNDKRIQKLMAEGKKRKMTTYFTDINIVNNVSKEYPKRGTQFLIHLEEQAVLR